ncbi:MAG: NAD(P)/FAD-dependent oxidoreductase [Pirellulaceae bacterium]|nr:NAD(P)/FAD-dependent oxidoreductase [Pirellulaceae bacterium]
MNDAFDGIILGSGHNSLVLQAYAARSGLRTVCLEQAAEAGGGLRTEELPAGSGFRHNTHSFYHRGLTSLPWYSDLELNWLGAKYLTPPLNVALITRDGRSLEWWTDFDQTVESFQRIDPRDAETLLRWRRRFRPIVQHILAPEAQAPPLPGDERERRLQQTFEGRLLWDTSRLSPLEFVRREFRHPLIQAGLLFFNGLREVDLRQPGFGHHIPALLASDGMAQMCRGGSRQLAAALVAAIQEAGSQVRLSTRPRRILVEQGRAAGVETDQGDLLRARHFVASGLNPQQTFLELLDPRHLPDVWRQRAEQFQYNVLAPLFGLYLNLREPPAYAAAANRPELARAFMVILGLEHVDQFPEIVAHHEAGSIPPTVMWGSCPSLFDLRQAPRQQHTAFMWEKLPYHLRGNPSNWDDELPRHAERMLNLWTQYAPNLPGAVIEWFARSPLDVERTLPNMRFGDLLVGAFSHGQIGYHRPFPGAGHYRTHLPGLYLCGSCCHPGGNVTGLPGYNCAQVLLADLGLPSPAAART